jgi:hypothetical protein
MGGRHHKGRSGKTTSWYGILKNPQKELLLGNEFAFDLEGVMTTMSLKKIAMLDRDFFLTTVLHMGGTFCQAHAVVKVIIVDAKN